MPPETVLEVVIQKTFVKDDFTFSDTSFECSRAIEEDPICPDGVPFQRHSGPSSTKTNPYVMSSAVSITPSEAPPTDPQEYVKYLEDSLKEMGNHINLLKSHSRGSYTLETETQQCLDIVTSSRNTVLVTSCTSQLGCWLIYSLQHAGFHVSGICPSLVSTEALKLRNMFPNLVLFQEPSSISEEAAWDIALAQCKTVFYLASECSALNVYERTKKMLRLVLKHNVKSFIYTGVLHNIIGGWEGDGDKIFTGEEWASIPDKNNSFYPHLKAEKCLWKTRMKNPQLKVASILPGQLLGPPLFDSDANSISSSSNDLVKSVLRQNFGAFGFSFPSTANWMVKKLSNNRSLPRSASLYTSANVAISCPNAKNLLKTKHFRCWKEAVVDKI